MMHLKRIPLIDGLRVDEAHKGGKAKEPEKQPLIAPTAPVEEASVEIGDDEDKKKKTKTGKSALKLPLADTASTGLKV